MLKTHDMEWDSPKVNLCQAREKIQLVRCLLCMWPTWLDTQRHLESSAFGQE